MRIRFRTRAVYAPNHQFQEISGKPCSVLYLASGMRIYQRCKRAQNFRAEAHKGVGICRFRAVVLVYPALQKIEYSRASNGQSGKIPPICFRHDDVPIIACRPARAATQSPERSFPSTSSRFPARVSCGLDISPPKERAGLFRSPPRAARLR